MCVHVCMCVLSISMYLSLSLFIAIIYLSMHLLYIYLPSYLPIIYLSNILNGETLLQQINCPRPALYSSCYALSSNSYYRVQYRKQIKEELF